MKRYITLIAAAALVACSNEELSTPENMATSQAPVNFEAYTQRGLTRAGARGDIDNNNITGIGFGVFGYYTAGALYDQKATPNFMYNERVSNSGSGWAYEPVKYWPNEYGTNAKSEEVDRLSFFAYAPWTEVDPTTGNVLGDPNHDIVSVNKHGATGDPLVKYVVDTDPATSVDLLWGVAAENAADKYSPIDPNNTVTITPGKPFIDLVKPAKPADDKLSFNLKHALAKVKVTIDFIADAETPDGTSGTFYPEETRIYVRSFQMDGFALKGALNLNNNEMTEAGKPLWKDFDGAADLAFDEVIFQDGRKDGKEGQTNGAQTNETPLGLNPQIVENFCQTTTDGNGNTVFGATKNPGVTKTPTLLFGGDATVNGGYFYVIPRNEGTTPVNIQIVYDVETIDRKLIGKLSDGETHGISIENVISKDDIFSGIDFNAGCQYEIKIHLGMTSAKIDATVTPWVDNGSTNVNLPDQDKVTAALNYHYPDGYQYNYESITVDGNDITATYPLGTANMDYLHDIARFLGALYRASGVQEIEYNGTTYHWDPAAAGAHSNPAVAGLKGSNWVDNAGNTLVSAIAANANTIPQNGLTIKADGDEINFKIQSSITGGGANPVNPPGPNPPIPFP